MFYFYTIHYPGNNYMILNNELYNNIQQFRNKLQLIFSFYQK